MGFFKNIKEKMFTLNIDDKKVNKKSEAKKTGSENNKLSNADKKLFKKQKKMQKYIAGLEKSSLSFSDKIKSLLYSKREIDESLFEELEEILIMEDISTEVILKLLAKVKLEVKKNKLTKAQDIIEVLIDQMHDIYGSSDNQLSIKDNQLNVIIMVGVNGSGKTTSIAKLAKMFKEEGKKVTIAAGDTFRAGAVNQLNVWAQRIGVNIIKPNKEGADPASVVYDALDYSITHNDEILIIDTAGRLQNKVHLMNELTKMKSIIFKKLKREPNDVLLVIDATTGQNGISQAKHFKDAVNVSGIILTKLDGTSKGGIVLTIKDQFKIPVKFIGLGESLDDLQEFDKDLFIYGLTKGLFNEN